MHLGRTSRAGADGRYDVMTESPADEPPGSAVPGELFRLAIGVVSDLLATERPDFAGHLAAIAATVERERLGPSTAAIAAAARRRSIPVQRVGGSSMLRLGYGAALTLPGDRRDDLVVESARAVAAWFGRVVIYEDQDLRGRRSGELRELIATALRTARCEIEIAHADGPHDAVRLAVELAGGGPVLFVYEKLDHAREALDKIGAIPWPQDQPTP